MKKRKGKTHAREIAEKLHRFEKIVLLCLKKSKEMDLDELVKESELKEVEVMRAILWLRSKELIEVEETPMKLFKLSELGEKYYEGSLPEERAFNLIKEKRKIRIPELKDELSLDERELEISLGILKRSGVIKIQKGEILFISSKGIESELERKKKVLEAVSRGLEIKSSGELEELRKRGIIVEEVKTKRKVRITKFGEEVSKFVKLIEEIDQLTPELLRSGKWKGLSFRKYDIFSPSPKIFPGKRHRYIRFIRWVKKKLIELGFEEMKGPCVELNFINCDILFMPQDHPARDIHDLFFLKYPSDGNLEKYKKILKRVKETHENGWKTGSTGWGVKFSEELARKLILRSHCTAVSARKLLSKDLKIPGKYFTISRTYRPELDWKHLPEFFQLDGIIVGKNLNFRNLVEVLKIFAEEIAGAEKYEIVPSYFPFTEPSAELIAYKKDFGWIELGGSGIFRPEVVMPLGIKARVIAWGLGFDRLFMIKEGVKDIRHIFSRDLAWLRGEK